MISAQGRRSGFTIIEMSTATCVTAVLASGLWFGWHGLCKATVDLIARAQLAQEMDFVAAALSRDLGGCIANSVGQAATFPVCSVSSDSGTLMIPVGDTDNHQIRYYQDTSNSNPWQRNNLIRGYWDSSGTEISRFTVARNVDGITFGSSGTSLTITVNFSCNYHVSSIPDRSNPIVKRSCAFVTNIPSPKQQ
jgi:type II secretory pathway component PulJ